jgi:hypothetical protein
MSMADSAKLSALAALDAVEFQRKADLLVRKACVRLAREQGSEGLTWFPVDNTVEDPSGNVLPTAWLEIYLSNEGKAPATNCRMRLSSSDTPKRMRIEGSAVKRIAPAEVVKFGFLVPYIPLKEADHDIGFSVRFSFEDQLGQDTYSMGIEFSLNQEKSRYVHDPYWRVRVVPEFEIRHQLCKPPGEEDEDYYED